MRLGGHFECYGDILDPTTSETILVTSWDFCCCCYLFFVFNNCVLTSEALTVHEQEGN